MDKTLIDGLSKEDLIKVIATMHDTIQEWNNGYGLEKEEGDALIEIGSACTQYCSSKGSWGIPNPTQIIRDSKINKIVE
jgi:hypothetical protein